MQQAYKLLREGVMHNPLTLSVFESNSKMLSIIDNYLPYSTGIEIECSKQKNFDTLQFKAIAGVLAVDCDDSEQRYRIQPGLAGLIALYKITELLKEHSLLNPKSGIHYHIDCTDILSNTFQYLKRKASMTTEYNWILNELNTWNYTGTFNNRQIGQSKTNWVRVTSLQTIEFRIGEMSFDYDVLIKRILHCQSIVKRLKHILMSLNKTK